MSNFDENWELSTSKPSNYTKNSIFNRSITMNSTASLYSKKSSYVSSAASTIAEQKAASMKKWYESAGTSFNSKVKQLCNLFEPKLANKLNSNNVKDHTTTKLKTAKSFSISSNNNADVSCLNVSPVRLPGTEDRVVIYFTSLRGIRRTREDCDAVRMIFRAYKVFVDERDVSMDAAYRKELQGLIGEKHVSLPQVFIKGRHVGGVDVIRQWNETGELRKILQVLPIRDRRFVCDACGDVRFLPCCNCNGSRKLFDEDEEVMKRCLECNENGLIRCPECCL